MSYIPNPTIFEQTNRGTFQYDAYSRLLKDRIVFLASEVNEASANLIIAQLLFLEAEQPDADISFYINSPGGSVTAGLAIYDTMQYIKPQVQTICVGQAASMAAVLLSAGAAEKRIALKHSSIMLHQPWGGIGGQASDIEIQTKEILRIKKSLTNVLVEHTGQSSEKLAEDLERDFYLTAKEALEYGIVDTVIDKRDV